MEKRKPYILISNDDGYTAKGLRFLVEVLRPHYELLIVAPDGPRSGFSCSFTSTRPITANLISEEPGVTVYACSGSPVDCIKLALNRLVRRRPDLVIGGINHGDNASVNARYSGTVGVALEGAMQGLPAVAYSLCDHNHNADFEPLRPYLLSMTEECLRMRMPAFCCLNVNFPVMDSFKGVRLCRMAQSRWVNEIADCSRPGRRDENYYWLVGDCKELEPEQEDTDRWALFHGYISVSPVTVDTTDYAFLNTLRDNRTFVEKD